MIKAFLIILLIICVEVKGHSQADSVLSGTLNLYVVPLPWIDKNPRLRLGMEYHAPNHMGYSLEVGWGNRHLNHNRLEGVIWGNEYSLLEIRPEIKWYRKEERQFSTYFATEWYYLRMTDRLENEYYYPDKNAEPVYYDEAAFRKEKVGLQVKAGIKFLIAKRFMLDLYEGVGLAYRNIKYTDVINPIENEFPTTEEWWGESYRHAGKYLLFQLSLGVRVGYVIGKI